MTCHIPSGRITDQLSGWLFGESPLDSSSRETGLRQYELKNHLGKVLVTVGDWKEGFDSAEEDPDASALYYQAHVTTAQDYYPFGMLMPERRFPAPCEVDTLIDTVTVFNDTKFNPVSKFLYFLPKCRSILHKLFISKIRYF